MQSPTHASSMETVSLMRTAVSPSSSGRPLTPRSALAATYATYVVRVHTRHGIKTISFDLLAAFFTYTAKKAAEDLGISSRTLIRVCRSLGIRRWPYLGFRSEKNVERIRQEAIENLRRKLEREGAETTTSVTSPSTSCLRGASAKRLLQVKLPQVAAAVAPMPKNHLPHYYNQQINHCVNTIVSPSAGIHHSHMHHMHHNMHSQAQVQHHNFSQQHHSQIHHQGMPLLTPPPTHQAFNLEREPTLSPRRVHMHAAAVHHMHQYHHKAPSAVSSAASSPSSSSASAASSPSSHMPSLNVLMEASILTAFKHEMTRPTESPRAAETTADAHNARTMSMRDILSHTALAA